MSTIGAILGLIVCFYILTKTTDMLVDSITAIGHKLQIPESVLGATLAAMATSAPEFFTTISSLGLESPAVGIGTSLGSCIFNLAVIIYVCTKFRDCKISRRVLTRDGMMHVAMLILLALSFYGSGAHKTITRLEATSWVVLFCVYIFQLLHDIRKKPEAPHVSDHGDVTARQMLAFPLAIAIIGVVSFFMVKFTMQIAHVMNIDEGRISVLVIAAGTSLPDVLTSYAAAKRGLGAMAIANALGSNIFNVLGALGLPFMIYGDVTLNPGFSRTVDICMPFLAVILFFTMIFIRSGWKLNRNEGRFLLLLYGVFLIFVMCQEKLG